MYEKPNPGKNLNLSIDLNIQSYALSRLQNINTKKKRCCMWSLTLAIEKAHFQYLKSLRKIHKKRKTIKKSNLHLHKGYSKRSIIWNYFLKGNKKFSEIIINN